MYKDLKFPVLIVHRDIKADTVAGDRVRAIAQSLPRTASAFCPLPVRQKGVLSLPLITAWLASWWPPRVRGRTAACCRTWSS